MIYRSSDRFKYLLLQYIVYPICKGVSEMEYTFCGTGCGTRSFLTKEEKVEMLKEYKESLEKELQGVAERIKELQKNN